MSNITIGRYADGDMGQWSGWVEGVTETGDSWITSSRPEHENAPALDPVTKPGSAGASTAAGGTGGRQRCGPKFLACQ